MWKRHKPLFILVLLLMSFSEKNDLVINTDINSCDKYRNIKIIFVNCNNQQSVEFITSCRIEEHKIIVPSVLSNELFKKSYESADYMKLKLLKGTSCIEQVVKL